jgi:hypothetical protein
MPAVYCNMSGDLPEEQEANNLSKGIPLIRKYMYLLTKFNKSFNTLLKTDFSCRSAPNKVADCMF